MPADQNSHESYLRALGPHRGCGDVAILRCGSQAAHRVGTALWPGWDQHSGPVSATRPRDDDGVRVCRGDRQECSRAFAALVGMSQFEVSEIVAGRR